MLENLEARRIAEPRDPQLVSFFPGSRAREIRKLLPIMLEVMQQLHARRPELRFEIAAASESLGETIRRGLTAREDSLGRAVSVSVGEAARTMQRSAVGLVASGTATLEAAFFRLPFLLVYKVAGLTFLAGKLLVRVKHLGMPNILAQKQIVPEFVQGAAQPAKLAAELGRLLDDPARRAQMVSDFDQVISRLGAGGASETAAHALLAALAKN